MSTPNLIKERSYGMYGTYYLEYIKFSFPPNISEFYDALEYDFNGLKYFTNRPDLVETLSAYFIYHELYKTSEFEDDMVEYLETAFDEYLASVPSVVPRLRGEREFIEYKDLVFTPRDYVTSVLENPHVSDYYVGHKDRIARNVERREAQRALNHYINKVVDEFMSIIDFYIENRTKVIWEVPHTIYRSYNKPIDDNDIFEGKISPIAQLSKYEHEYYDYGVGFNVRIFYKVVEHLPGGDRILPFDIDGTYANNPLATIYKQFMRRVRKRDEDNNIYFEYDYQLFRKPQYCRIKEDDDGNKKGIGNCRGNAQFFVPFPNIVRAPWCRGMPNWPVIPYEGRFSNTYPWGGAIYQCPELPDPRPQPRNIIHRLSYNVERRRVSGSSNVAVLSHRATGTVDLRDFEPPKIHGTNQWYTTPEHNMFGEYPGLELREEEHWWEDYREANINNNDDWHSFWNEKMLLDKDDLVWYVNNHIKG